MPSFPCDFRLCVPIPFQSPGSAAKSCTGLLEWPDQDTALDAFVLANHQTIYSQSTSDHHTAPGDPPSSSLLVTTVVYLPDLLSVPPLHHHYVMPPLLCTEVQCCESEVMSCSFSPPLHVRWPGLYIQDGLLKQHLFGAVHGCTESGKGAAVASS